MMSCIAYTVSSIVVSGSARWQYNTSTKSCWRRSSEPSIACIRYLRLSVFRMFGTLPWMPQNTFVVSTYEYRGQPSSCRTRPMIASLLPPAYTSALSKKLHPASWAACMQSSARLSSSWVSNVTQLPNDSTLTLMPVRPSRRYSISVVLGMSAMATSTGDADGYAGRSRPDD